MSAKDTILEITSYTGPKDKEGRPNGYGVAYYRKKRHEYKYEGMFLAGKRHGFGTYFCKGTIENPQEEWQWYMEGEYDSAGRLIQPRHEPGSYTKYIDKWWCEYSGWWRDDAMIESYTKADGYATYVDDFEITQDEAFLSHFHDSRLVRLLSPTMVEKLSRSDNPYARYGYGKWLYSTQYGDTSLIEATECFKYAAEHGVADAIMMLSELYYRGDVYNPRSQTYILNYALSQQLCYEALERGSQYAKLQHNYYQFHGIKGIAKDSEAALAEAENEARREAPSVLWLEQLGWHYSELERYDEAAELFERCIIEGYLRPMYELAMIHLKMGNEEYYRAIMKEGIRRNCSDCMVLGIEKESVWNDLHNSERASTSRQMRELLKRGAALNDGYCTYLIGHMYYYGHLDFLKDVPQALKYALAGVKLRDANSMMLATNILRDGKCSGTTLRELQITEHDILMLNLRALRYGAEGALETVIENQEQYAQMGYGDEIESVWIPKWLNSSSKESKERAKSNTKEDSLSDDDAMILLIHPSGTVDFVDIDPSDSRGLTQQIAELIDAEKVGMTIYAETLYKIAEECQLCGRLTLFYDMYGDEKSLELNPAATLLDTFGDVQGTVALALIDDENNYTPFASEEEAESLFEALEQLTNGQVSREWEEDDSRYDAWA